MHQVEVSRVVTASAERVYALISDLPRMGEWSPENNGGSWVKGASGPAVGAVFKGKNAKGRIKWSTLSKVVVATPAQEFAFDVTVKGFAVARWGYLIETVAGGTKVTEYWDDHRNPVMKKLTGLALGIPDRVVHNTAGMEHTLDRIAAAV